MKKMILVLAFIATTFYVNAQDETTYKRFRWDNYLGYAISGGEGAKAGIIFSGGPKYALNDMISIGLRTEGAVMLRAITPTNGEPETTEVKVSSSYLLTGDYYFNTNKFRPFAGIGAGIFMTAGGNVDGNGNGELQEAKKFGFSPRVGFDYGHFTTMIDYNFVGKTGEISNSYIGIKIGFFLGGGIRD